MKATIRIFIISAALIIPWGIIRLAGWEPGLVASMRSLNLSGVAILALLILPLLAIFLLRWLFEPRTKTGKRYSGNKNIMIRFRG